MRRLILVLAGVVLVGVMLGAACGDDNIPSAQKVTTDVASEREDIYTPINFIDFQNWNQWAEMSDNPSTILWCTFFPATHEKITVPIVGKFTDSGKTPFPTKFELVKSSGNDIAPAELADPFAMYGVSSEFQYGFDPSGNFTSFSQSIPSMCSSVPRVFQSVEAHIVIEIDTALQEITERAQAALKAGDDAGAIAILNEAAN